MNSYLKYRENQINLGSFSALVDSYLNLSPANSQHTDEREILIAIRDCFTVQESDQARSYVRNIIDDIGLRYICDQAPSEPYFAVAMALQLALRERGRSAANTSNWNRAVELGVQYAFRFPSVLPPEQRWVSNTRVSSLSIAVKELRDLGYNIDLPATGGVAVPDATTNRLANDIAKRSASLGRALASNAAGAMQGSYSIITGRFRLGRAGQTVQLNVKPEVPLAYLYQLGLRYFAQVTSPQNLYQSI